MRCTRVLHHAWIPLPERGCRYDVGFMIRVDCMTRTTAPSCVIYAEIPAMPSISCQVVKPGLIIAFGFEHPASTLPTRFPAALGIGHGMPAA